ncbi:hypothetical protein LTR74_014141 [Friedmanniomyces endolithicus]|nr:hypothetical protein LTR74_014141 [Friedmanniomyces endolithicus]
MPATFKKLVDDVENRLRHATSDANKAEDALATALTTAGAPQYCRTTAAAFADAEQKFRTAESEVTAALSRLYASLASLRDREALREADREKARERAQHRRRSKQRYRSHAAPEDYTSTRSSRRNPPPPPPPKPKPKTRQQAHVPKPRVISPESIQKWHEACTLAFQNKPLMRAFPPPPSEPCGDARCRAERRVLEACYCNIRKAFKGRADLRGDRLRFHPDRFMRVPGDVRERVRRAAGDVFVVVQRMYQKVCVEGTEGS